MNFFSLSNSLFFTRLVETNYTLMRINSELAQKIGDARKESPVNLAPIAKQVELLYEQAYFFARQLEETRSDYDVSVANERRRIQGIYGVQTHLDNLAEWYLILSEEVGEVANALNELLTAPQFEQLNSRKYVYALISELVQVGAVLVEFGDLYNQTCTDYAQKIFKTYPYIG